MFRKLLIAAAALAVSACSYGSAIDIAPMGDRLDHPLVTPGVYCGVKGAQGAYLVSAGDDCGRIKWNAARRSLAVIDEDKPKDTLLLAVVPLGDGLYATQYDINDPPGRPDRHQLNVIIASGKAFAVLGVLDGDELDEVLKRHPGVKMARADHRDDYIAGGDIAAIRDFLRGAARASLRVARAKGDEMDVDVLDKGGKTDHPASPAQIRDVEAVKAIAAKLTPE
jgi:hypothetical protein